MTSALLEATVDAGAGQLLEVRLDEIHESPKNPRTHYDPAALQQLADNLEKIGQITPAIARPRQRGGYELAAGHRRLRAKKLAGLPTLLTLVRPMSDAEFVELLNIENLQRDDLNALEEAQGFVTLMKDAGYEVPKIADRVGRSIKYVYDRIKLLQLVPEAKKLLTDGTITPGHGILLARLSKDDQKRALEADDGSYRSGGLLEREQIDDGYFAQEPQLDLEDPKKARSVRELQQWIDRNVRFIPAKVDQADLAFDLPKTAELLDTAATKKLKVVKITREYRVPDEARDEKERTYGENCWKRADGEPEPDPYAKGKPKPSKTCEYSGVGLVVAGPGRGEAFLVCVNKDKCAVHWAEEIKAKAKRAADREKGASRSNGAPAKPERDTWAEEQVRRQKRVEAVRPVRTAVVEAVLAKVEAPLSISVLRLVAVQLLTRSRLPDLAKKVLGATSGLLSESQIQGRVSNLDQSQLARAIVLGLIGSDAVVEPYTVDRKPEDLLDLCTLYRVNPDAIAVQIKQAAKAEAVKVQPSAKPKKRAGDVARERRKRKARKS